MEQIENNDSWIGDIPDVEGEDYALERKKLARRRKLAEEMLGTKAPGLIKAGDVFAMSAPDIGGAISRGVGKYEMNLADELETRLGQRERADQMKTLTSIPALGDANREQAQYAAAIKMPSLRGMIEHQMGADSRSQERDAERQWRTEQADLNRVESGEQKAADRVAKEDLKQIPTVQIFHKDGSTNAAASANASNAAQQYAGQVTQIGSDSNGNPIFRHTKSGKNFGFDPQTGHPKEHEGPVLPKAAADKPLNENQGNAAIYGARAGESHKALDTVGTDYSPIKVDMAHGSTNVPGIGSLVNAGLGEKEQQVVQAQRDFVNAVMRRESGAAIQPSEFSNARKQYFPQPGDGDKVLAQKRANRELVIKGLAEVSGPAGKKAISAMTPSQSGSKPVVVRTVKLKDGRTGVEYSDGTRGYQ